MTVRSHKSQEQVLGVVCGSKVRCYDGNKYIHAATGRVLDALAARYERLCLCAPTKDGVPPGAMDPKLISPNIELVPQPYYDNTIGALKHVVGIGLAYARLCRQADVIFVRGLCPYIGLLYAFAFIHGRRVCHWIVGDPVALIRTHPRAGRILDTLSLFYAIQDRALSRLGRWLTKGAFICNGEALAHAYASPRTVATVSSSVKDEEFLVRADTCQGPTVRILFLGYVRPEKGVQYLLEAVGRLKTDRPWELVLAGPWQEWAEYRAQLDRIIEEKNIANRVHWTGYISYGQPVLQCIREADILVLPSLSEGTPHVLVEAASNSLPMVATAVGGIPSMITDGSNGLLVPAKDPEAIAAAIDRIIANGEFRRGIIRSALTKAHEWTVDHFVEVAASLLAGR